MIEPHDLTAAVGLPAYADRYRLDGATMTLFLVRNDRDDGETWWHVSSSGDIGGSLVAFDVYGDAVDAAFVWIAKRERAVELRAAADAADAEAGDVFRRARIADSRVPAAG